MYTLAEKAVLALLVTITLVLMIGLVDSAFARSVLDGSAIVVSKEYTPAESSVGVGIINNPDGTSSTALVYSGSSAEYEVAVQMESGETVIASTDITTFYALSDGDVVNIFRKTGLLTGRTVGYVVTK